MQKNKKYNFSPKLAALIEALLRQGHVVRSDATARVSSGQTTQQVRRKKEIGDTVPKTRAEGRQRAANKAWERREQRRKSGKTIDLESSERAIAEATKPTGYTKLADFFHQFGEAAMADALIMSGIVNPIRTAFSVVGGALGGNAVDKKMLNLTKSDEKPEGQTWSEWVNDKLGLRQGHMVGQFSNPGILFGGAVGYKTPGAIDYLVRADLARFGFTPTTLYFFRPNYLGMNGSAVGKVETSPSEAVRKAYTAPNLERLEITTAEPLMNGSAVGKVEPFWDTKKFNLVKVTDKGQHLIKEKATGKSYIAEIKFKNEALNRGLNTDVSMTEEQKYEKFLNDEFLPKLKKLIETNAKNEKIQEFFNSYNTQQRLSANDINLLKKHAPYYNIPQRDSYSLVRPIIDKAIKDAKGAKGINNEINKSLIAYKSTTPEGRLKLLLEKYHPIMLEAFDRIKAEYGEGIDWNWENNSYFSDMPLDFKIKPLYDPHVKGVSDTRPFIQRFYENVEKIVKKGGLMDKVLESGDLKLNAKNQWVGRTESGKFKRVDPTLYIVSKIKNFKESENRLTINDEPVPYHGTMGTSAGTSEEYSALSQKYADGASKNNAIFTVIQDNMPGVGSMMTKYKGRGGVSIPFFRRLFKFEHPTFPVMNASDPQIIKAGSHGHYSNDYGIWGELKQYFKGNNGGYAQEVKSVTDPQSSGQRVNEYNFGAGTENVKSIWNTLDFEPQRIIRNPDGSIKEKIKTSPFAYNPSTVTINNQYT